MSEMGLDSSLGLGRVIGCLILFWSLRIGVLEQMILCPLAFPHQQVGNALRLSVTPPPYHVSTATSSESVDPSNHTSAKERKQLDKRNRQPDNAQLVA